MEATDTTPARTDALARTDLPAKPLEGNVFVPHNIHFGVQSAVYVALKEANGDQAAALEIMSHWY